MLANGQQSRLISAPSRDRFLIGAALSYGSPGTIVDHCANILRSTFDEWHLAVGTTPTGSPPADFSVLDVIADEVAQAPDSMSVWRGQFAFRRAVAELAQSGSGARSAWIGEHQFAILTNRYGVPPANGTEVAAELRAIAGAIRRGDAASLHPYDGAIAVAHRTATAARLAPWIEMAGRNRSGLEVA